MVTGPSFTVKKAENLLAGEMVQFSRGNTVFTGVVFTGERALLLLIISPEFTVKQTIAGDEFLVYQNWQMRIDESVDYDFNPNAYFSPPGSVVFSDEKSYLLFKSDNFGYNRIDLGNYQGYRDRINLINGVKIYSWYVFVAPYEGAILADYKYIVKVEAPDPRRPR